MHSLKVADVCGKYMRVRKWRQAGHIFAIGLSTLMPRPFSAYNVKTLFFSSIFISSTPFIPVSTRLPSYDHSILRPVASCVYISSCHALHILFLLLTRICQLFSSLLVMSRRYAFLFSVPPYFRHIHVCQQDYAQQHHCTFHCVESTDEYEALPISLDQKRRYLRGPHRFISLGQLHACAFEGLDKFHFLGSKNCKLQ